MPGAGSFQKKKKKSYMQCSFHRLFDELYFLMNHSNFSLIRKAYNFGI